jgi:N-acetylglucosamine repressor
LRKVLVTGNAGLMKEINQSLILNIIRRHEPISRSAIAKKTRLALPTVMRIVDELIKVGYLLETGKGTSTGGRKPVLLRLNPSAAYIVGVDITHKLTAILTDLKGRTINRIVEITKGEEGPEGAIQQMVRVVDRLLVSSDIDIKSVTGIGIGAPGWNFKSGPLIRSSIFFGWQDVDFNRLVKDRFAVPVVVVNTAKAGAYGELWFGKGQEVGDFVYILADVGVGSGVVLNGEMHTGQDRCAGELGHSIVDIKDGRPCYCGNRGCLEMYTSIPAIISRVMELMDHGHSCVINQLMKKRGNRIDFQMVITAMNMGDAVAIKVLEEAGGILGIGIANMINIYNPQLVILGGEISCSAPCFVEAAKGAAVKNVFSKPARNTPIVVAESREDAGALGAAAQVMDRFFKAVPLST